MPILKVENEELFVRDAILLQQAMVVDETGGFAVVVERSAKTSPWAACHASHRVYFE